MTTPGQPAPDGAYVIGGTGNAYGQEMTDQGAAQLMLGGFTTIASISNPLEAVASAMGMFAQQLLSLPLEVLKLFEPMIPGDLLGAFDTVAGAVSAIMDFFQTLGPMLTSAFNGFLTTTYNVLSSAVQQVIDIINGLIVTPINSAIQGVKDWWNNITGQTAANAAAAAAAQASANTANAGLALLNAQAAGSGTVFTDPFDRASATNLGADYDRSMGSGSGTFGTDGVGNAVWLAGGATVQTCLDRVITPMTTKYQSIAVVLTDPPLSTSTIGTLPSQQHMCLRMNAAKDTYVVAILTGGGAVEIGYVNSGSYTGIGAQEFPGMNSGDLWEFRAGVATSGVTEDYQFDLLKNGLTVCSRIDTGHLSLNGAAPATWVGTYDYGAIIARAGTNASFFTTFQMNSPPLQVLTVADRTP